jgi:predicted MPP superfamily phosphohydrolase
MARRRGFRIERHEVPAPALPAAADGLRIVHLSDLHVSPDWPWRRRLRALERLVRAARAERPDLVAITGDMVTGRPGSVAACEALLAPLEAPLGIFAVQGNWEHKHGLAGPGLRRALARAGVRLLVNESAALSGRAAGLFVAGLDDPLRGRPDLDKTLAEAPVPACVLLLMHAPAGVAALETWRRARPGRGPHVPLVLAGHTHGGQIRLPGLSPFWLPRGSGDYHAGFYTVGASRLYVSRGFAAVGILPLRFACPAEMAVLTLRAGAAQSAGDSPSPDASTSG